MVTPDKHDVPSKCSRDTDLALGNTNKGYTLGSSIFHKLAQTMRALLTSEAIAHASDPHHIDANDSRDTSVGATEQHKAELEDLKMQYLEAFRDHDVVMVMSFATGLCPTEAQEYVARAFDVCKANPHLGYADAAALVLLRSGIGTIASRTARPIDAIMVPILSPDIKQRILAIESEKKEEKKLKAKKDK